MSKKNFVSEILKVAEREMLKLNHPYVGSEHMILALLKNQEISDICNEYNLTYEIFKKELLNKNPVDWIGFYLGMAKNKTLWPTNAMRINNFLIANGFDIIEYRNAVALYVLDESLSIFREFSKILGSTVNDVLLSDFLRKYFTCYNGIPTEELINLINEHSKELRAHVVQDFIIIDL